MELITSNGEKVHYIAPATTVAGKPFAMFASPLTKAEDETTPVTREKENATVDNTPKKLTLMLARPLRFYRMGGKMMHIDAGNPALIIPSKKSDGTYYTKAVFPPFTGHYDENLVPIYNKKGKKIAATFYDDAFKAFQPAEKSHKRTYIPIAEENEAPEEKIKIPYLNETAFKFPSPSELACHLEFDQFDMDTLYDSSGHENDAQMHGATTLMHTNYSCGLAGRLIGGVVNFNGDKFNPKPQKAITVAAWLKLNETRGTQSVFSTGGRVGSNSQFHLDVSDGGRLAWMHMNEARDMVFQMWTPDSFVESNKWVHVAATYDADDSKCLLQCSLHDREINKYCE